MNFVEGTRFTSAKHQQQTSPFTDLLKVKAGGIAFVLDTMGENIKSILDVTIVYSDRRPGLFDLFAGCIRHVQIDIVERDIKPEMIGDYENDAVFRTSFQAWLNTLWQEKQKTIERLKAGME